MTGRNFEKTEGSGLSKQLRFERSNAIKRARKLLQEQRRIVSAIERALESGPKTVPEISELTSIPTREVLWWIASLKKYGFVAEEEKRESYFAYRLIKNFRISEG